MIKTFKDELLDDYYFNGGAPVNIPGTIERALRRKLDIIHVASGYHPGIVLNIYQEN